VTSTITVTDLWYIYRDIAFMWARVVSFILLVNDPMRPVIFLFISNTQVNDTSINKNAKN